MHTAEAFVVFVQNMKDLEEIMIEAKKFNSKVKKEPKLTYSEAFYSAVCHPNG
ncbi:hypothetical protein N9B53_04260 [Mariniblastus sp.]|nr:hypothetical protein [Mariniblastus sp.]